MQKLGFSGDVEPANGSKTICTQANFEHIGSILTLPSTASDRNRSRANAAGQAHFSRSTDVRNVFDHSEPAFDPEKNEPVPAHERLTSDWR